MSKLVTVKLPYGDNCVEAVLPQDNLLGYYRVKTKRPLSDIDKKVKQILNYPINSLPLKERVKGCRSVLIVVDDNTRRTPVKKILPHVLDILVSAGIKAENTTILFAAGSHRPMTKQEIINKVGEDVYQNIQTVNHNFRDELVYKGSTQLGTPIYVNRLLDQSDFVIGIGNIIPHRYCGWSGGGKIILPGVCGEESIAKTHLMITKDPNIKLGSTSNTALKEINSAAKKAGLGFIINTILNGEGEVVDIVAGEVEAAHKQGIQRAEKVLGSSIPESDVVIISSYPEDLNLWQSLKALYSAELVVKKGGVIILITPLHEGIGEHTEFVKLLSCSAAEIKHKIENNKVSDLISAAAAYAEALVKEKAQIILVTDGIDNEVSSTMGFKKIPELQNAVDYVLNKKSDAKVVCIREGTEILPVKGD